MSSVVTQDIFIPTARGRLFARGWTPGASVQQAPIVLLHDSLGCVELWRDFPLLLAEATGRTVIAYDRLGFGRSDTHEGKLGPDFVDREAHEGFAAVREAFGLDEFVAFGHSVGGGMAIACAAGHRESCRGLITESAQVFVEERTLNGIRLARDSFAQPGQLERLKKYHGEKASWVLGAWVDTWLSADFAQWNSDDNLRRRSCPVLAIHGDSDEYGSIQHPQRIGQLTEAEVLVLAGCGHVPHREMPDAVLASIAGWLPRPG